MAICPFYALKLLVASLNLVILLYLLIIMIFLGYFVYEAFFTLLVFHFESVLELFNEDVHLIIVQLF